jgi:hypothetical protein
MALRNRRRVTHYYGDDTPQPPTLPEPKKGCKICTALHEQLQVVSDPRSPDYDPSKATDIRVEMRRHDKGQVH